MMPWVARAAGIGAQLGSGMLLLDHGSIPLILLLHVGGAAAWGWGAPGQHVRGEWRGPALAGVFALLIPGVGWLVAWLMGLIVSRPPPKTEQARLLVWRERQVRDNFQIPRALGPSYSIAEILRGPNAESRRNAILAVKDLEVRAALPLLRKGLQDSDEQVRIFAQNSLSELLEKFEKRIKVLEARSRDLPADVAAAVGLAEQYFELVYLDVAGDEETGAHLLNQAVTILNRVAKQAPQNPRVALLQLRYALRQRNCPIAREALARAKQLNLDEQVVLPWEAELAFISRDWRKLKTLLASFVDRRFVNPRIEALAAYWSRTEAPR